VDETWYRRVARGAGAGALATVAMSAVQFPGARRAERLAPPVEITRRLHLRHGASPPRPAVVAEAVLLHLAFGASGGALYALVAPRRQREVTASLFTGALYALSYRGWLPSLGLHPHSDDDDRSRQAANVAGHVVYGLTLAELLRLTDPHPHAVDDR
jgi:hypothetical protein